MIHTTAQEMAQGQSMVITKSWRCNMNIKDLDIDTIKKLGISDLVPSEPTKRRKQLTKDEIRGLSISCLSVLSKLSQSDRTRVLEHAIKINKV
tara:strand:+ start:90 stop:368 length:279 start_codon:yes stop_codon:yes gene_type:complete